MVAGSVSLKIETMIPKLTLVFTSPPENGGGDEQMVIFRSGPPLTGDGKVCGSLA